MVCEDTDWCVRARRAGFGIGYVDKAKIWHKESYTIRYTTGKWLRDYYNMRNSLLLARKHARWYHWPTLSMCLAGTLVYRTAGYCVRWELERVRALYRGLRDGLKCELATRLSQGAEPSL
jgi:GT2 family glycosyltransferase